MTNAVMPDEFRGHIRLGKLPKAPPSKPAPPGARKPPEPRVAFALGVSPDFSQRYRVTLTAGMTDVYGQRLAKDVWFDVDTESPFSHAKPSPAPPPAAPAEPSQGAPPPADVPSRAIPPFEATLGVVGDVLEAGAWSHKIPVGLVNVPTFGVIARSVTPRDVKQWLAGTATSPGGFLSGGFRFAWQTPNPAANVRFVEPIDVDALLAPVGRGAAALALGVPGSVGPVRQQLLSLTDLAITARMSSFGSLVWVTSLSTGKPVAGAEVAVGRLKKEDAATFTTDAQGLAFVPADAFTPVIVAKAGYGGEAGTPDAESVVFARKGDDWTYQRVEISPTFTRAAPRVDLAASKEWEGTLFADRGVYRRGETVKLAAIVRQADARGLTVAGGHDVRLLVQDAQGDKLVETRGKLDAFGGLALDAPLPKTAHIGGATATLSIVGGRSELSTSFLIADFKPAEFAVSVRADKDQYVRGDRARFAVHGEYLFQAPMARASAHVTAVRSTASFTPKGAEAYVTTDEEFTGAYGDASPRAGELLERDITLDASGDHDEPLDLAMPGQTHPEMVSFESNVEDFTRQVVAGSTSVIVHPAEFYVGMRRLPSRFVATGATVAPDVAALRPDGTLAAGAAVKMELLRREWTTVVEDQGSGSRKSTVRDVPIGSCDLVTAPKAVSCPLRVPDAGYYIVRATSRDGRGNVVRASTGLYSLSDRPDVPTRAIIGWSESDARTVRLEHDKAEYDAGETAKILVRNPFKEAEALVTVERGGVLTSQTTTLRGPMPVVSIPIRDDYFPNVFVSVHLVRGRLQAPPASGADVGGPDYREGNAELRVSPSSHRLRVEVKPDRRDHRPGDDLDADVEVRDAGGNPARAELTFYAVDEGVLMLTGYQTPDPLPAFTRARSLAVFGMESRDHLAKIVALKQGEKLQNIGYETRAGDKGEDGGGGDEPGGGKARRDFRNTAYFEAGRVTGDDGRAHFHFKLPDNLTSFRLMAVAAASDRFGSGQASVTSSKRLMARPALPRAVRVGDKLDASVVVSGKGFGGAPVDVAIRLGSPLALAGPATQRAVVPASGSVEVHFPVVARAPGDATIAFDVRGAGERDSVEVHKRVALPLHLETAAVYGETSKTAAVALGDLSKIRSDEGALDVRLSSSALVGLDSAFDHLESYPYGCTEQLASRLIPLVALDDLAHSVGVRVPARNDGAIEDAVDRMLDHQRPSGGFGYWDTDAEEPWLSAYAMLTLDAAAKKGAHVPHEALDRGVEYLRTTLSAEKLEPDHEAENKDSTGDDAAEPSSADEGPSPEDRLAHAYAEAAFIADVLATLGKPDPGMLNRLYDARAHGAAFTQALLLHAMATALMPRAQLEALTTEITGHLRIDADAAFAEEADPVYAPLLDSPARTTALVLRALLAVDPQHPLASRLAKGLLAARKTGGWRSTQENAWALTALDAYRSAQEAAKPDFDVDVFLGSTRIGGDGFHQASLKDQRITMLPSRAKELGGPLTFAVTGAGRLFYSAELKYEITDLPAKAVDRGLFVQKTLRAVKLEDLAAATQWIPKKTADTARAGDLVVVDVLLESAEPREQVVVADPLPAGLEAVDFDFKTTGQLHGVNDTVRSDVAKAPADALTDVGTPFRDASYHREIEDDRVLTFIPRLPPGIYHFRYLARATVVGQYVVPPTSAECMYSPEVYGRTRATTFAVVR
jgi:uncharacterized protein YfaS (alpha-2-macroglobulin family)